MRASRAGNPAAYTTFVEARERAWDEPLRQPIERCVESLLALIIRTVETSKDAVVHPSDALVKLPVERPVRRVQCDLLAVSTARQDAQAKEAREKVLK